MRVGRYFAGAVLGWFVAFAALALAMVLGAGLDLSRGEGTPAVWSLFAPLFALAVFVAWWRMRAHGEDVAAAAAGSGPAQLLPVVLLGVALQVVLALPGGFLPTTNAGERPVQRGLAGELLAPGDRPVVLHRDGRVEVLPAGHRIGDFQAMPHNPQRYRRQAFFLCAPRLAPANDLDPIVLRWCFAVLAILVPVGLTRVREPRWWGCALLPAVIPVLLL